MLYRLRRVAALLWVGGSTSPPAPPSASNVAITGDLFVGDELTGTYTYSGDEPESGSTYVWQRADDVSGTGAATIAGATATTYTPTEDDEGKFIRFGVTPSDGTTTGTQAFSDWEGAILMQQAQFQYQLASGNNGAASGGTGYVQCPLNTTIANTITGASIAANVVTLPAGTYRMSATTVALAGDPSGTRCRLRDTTNTATLALGLCAGADSFGGAATAAPSTASITSVVLAGATDIQVDVYFGTAGTFGSARTTGENELYANLEIWKLA